MKSETVSVYGKVVSANHVGLNTVTTNGILLIDGSKIISFYAVVMHNTHYIQVIMNGHVTDVLLMKLTCEYKAEWRNYSI